MTTPTVYVICDQNCKFESMTKEQILAAIAQAVETGEIKDVDTGFVQTIKTINGHPLKFFVGEQSAYDALTEEDKKDLFAIITNDTTAAGILDAIAELDEALRSEIKGVYAKLKRTNNELFNPPMLDVYKKLFDVGYYYISCAKEDELRYSFGLVYWDGSRIVTAAGPDNAFTLFVGKEGWLQIFDKDSNELTSEYNFYIAQMWSEDLWLT